MNRPEQALQRQLVEYLRWALKPPALFTSFPAGGGGMVRGRILKGTGLRAGWPDLQIVADGRLYLLELKAGTSLSDAQKATHEALRAAKIPVEVITSLDDLRGLIANGWWPLRQYIRETKPQTERIRRGFAKAAL